MDVMKKTMKKIGDMKNYWDENKDSLGKAIRELKYTDIDETLSSIGDEEDSSVRKPTTEDSKDSKD